MKIKYALSLVALVLVGCNTDKGDKFVGHWVEVNTSDAKPMTLDITAQGSSVLVEEKKTVFGKEFHDSYVAAVISAKEASIDGGVASVRMLIADDSGLLRYKGRALEKTH
jgi:hypothetical protein